MNFVVTDLGASSTRVVSELGVISTIPNNMVYLGELDKVDLEPHITGESAGDDFRASMDISIRKTSGSNSDFFPCRVLVGELADRFSSVNTRPSVLNNKSAQKINYISAILAVTYEVLVNGVPGDAIDLYVALPPTEVKNAKELVAERLVGSYEVRLNKSDSTVTFNIKNVICAEESVMALFSFYFNMNGTVNKSSVEYTEGNIMSLDVGASTTDIAVSKDKKYLEKSGQTFKTGGNIIQSYMASVIRGQFGYDATDEALLEVVATGRLRRGNKYIDMSKELGQAKREFARSIIEQIQNYFRLVNIPLQDIRAIVVSGGGSITSGYTDKDTGEFIQTCEPVSHFITEALKDIVDSVDVISITEEPRYANIRGLYVKATVDMYKKKRAGAV